MIRRDLRARGQRPVAAREWRTAAVHEAECGPVGQGHGPYDELAIGRVLHQGIPSRRAWRPVHYIADCAGYQRGGGGTLVLLMGNERP